MPDGRETFPNAGPAERLDVIDGFDELLGSFGRGRRNEDEAIAAYTAVRQSTGGRLLRRLDAFRSEHRAEHSGYRLVRDDREHHDVRLATSDQSADPALQAHQPNATQSRRLGSSGVIP